MEIAGLSALRAQLEIIKAKLEELCNKQQTVAVVDAPAETNGSLLQP